MFRNKLYSLSRGVREMFSFWGERDNSQKQRALLNEKPRFVKKR